MNRDREKIVRFELCNLCVHKDLDEINEPCADCLDYPVNIDSQRPIHFESNGILPPSKKESKSDGRNCNNSGCIDIYEEFIRKSKKTTKKNEHSSS